MRLNIPKVKDFELTGAGDAATWKKAEWSTLAKVGKGTLVYESKVKCVYSATGIYFLFDCEDEKLTNTGLKDMGNLFMEDVVEVFLWPCEDFPVYFEYELSPLDKELPIIVPNCNGKFHGWLPWHYEGKRKCRHATAVRGGKKKPGASVSGWSAEMFIPYHLLSGLENTPPKAGSTWRANMYRLDYGSKLTTHWAWAKETGTRFHKFANFGTLVFGK